MPLTCTLFTLTVAMQCGRYAKQSAQQATVADECRHTTCVLGAKGEAHHVTALQRFLSGHRGGMADW